MFVSEIIIIILLKYHNPFSKRRLIFKHKKESATKKRSSKSFKLNVLCHLLYGMISQMQILFIRKKCKRKLFYYLQKFPTSKIDLITSNYCTCQSWHMSLFRMTVKCEFPILILGQSLSCL